VRTAYNVLNGIEMVELVVLALVAIRVWLHQRSEASAWLATSFGLLGGVVTFGRLIPSHPHGFWESLSIRVLILVIAVFPYLLYRFMLTFSPRRPRVYAVATASTLMICVWTLALPHFPSAGDKESRGFLVFIVAFLIQWCSLSLLVAWSLWRAARGEPTVARQRMRTLSVAAACLAFALLVSGASGNSDTIHPLQLAVEIFVLVTVPFFLVGMAPPTFLLAHWRLRDQVALREGTIALVQATTPDEICANLLPRLTQFIGGHGAAIFAADGSVIGSYAVGGPALAHLMRRMNAHSATEGLVHDGEALWMPLSSGWLVLITTTFTPFFGQDEAKTLMSIGVLTDMALSRAALLVRDKEHIAAMREFVAIASHDLRTPTAAITGYASLLENRWDSLADEQRREMVHAVHRQCGHLGRLVEDLLTTSRLDAAALPTEPVLLDVRREVDRILDDLDAAVDIDVRPGIVVLIDPEHLRRILTNYVRNAVVYGAGPLSVGASVEQGVVKVWVADHGPGVAAEFVPRLFERFSRADKKTSTATGGTGLGLSIVQGLAQAAGGHVWYADNQPHGAVFGVSLPVPVPQQPTKESRWTSGGSSSSSRTKLTSAG
jgi:signal transduction histidine kinase